ncbi:hypothetical protein PVAP13_9KG383800 [Panicum virgatum]|uniref:Uncharacterized protein n=1 Tax=Panicum virgatum TaxID=38727 RepID=A0A8T0NRQ6_PANVG|nr:hypothetical protein PVAP13_9KG383800 [Panicum virgatum]
MTASRASHSPCSDHCVTVSGASSIVSNIQSLVASNMCHLRSLSTPSCCYFIAE